MRGQTILITGSAGFIGYHLSLALLKKGYRVIGVDRLSESKTRLNRDRNAKLLEHSNFSFVRMDITEGEALTLFSEIPPVDAIFHFAGPSSIQFSMEHPRANFREDVRGTLALFEALTQQPVRPHLFYSSSASVYGDKESVPFREDDSIGPPTSMYAVTKYSTELMLQLFSRTHGFSATVFRIFSAYGPKMNPDVALFQWISKIINQEPLVVYKGGLMYRDMIFADDLVNGMIQVMEKRLEGQEANKFEVFNLGSGSMISNLELLHTLENEIGKAAEFKILDGSQGRMEKTLANTAKIRKYCGFEPKVRLAEGVKATVDWYRQWSQESVEPHDKIQAGKKYVG